MMKSVHHVFLLKLKLFQRLDSYSGVIFPKMRNFQNFGSGVLLLLFRSKILSLEQLNNRWAVKLNTSIYDTPSWAICDKSTTVAVSRLTADRNGIKRLSENEFNTVLKTLFEWLPKLPLEKEVQIC